MSQVTVSAGPDKAVNSGSTVTLDGSATVVDGYGTTTRLWELVEGEPAGTLVLADVLQPALIAPTLDPSGAENRDTTLTYRLTVENDGVSDSDDVDVAVTAPVTSVIVNAGSGKTVDSGGQVTLDGSMIVTNDFGPTTILWESVTGSTAERGELDDTASLTPTWTAPTLEVGDPLLHAEWRLTVSNNGISASASISLHVRPPTE